MAVIVVCGSEPGVGVTTVAVGLAHRLAYAGHAVRLERLAGGTRAQADAATFAALDFIEASGTPIEADAIQSAAGVTVIDASHQADAGSLATRLGAALLL